MLRLPKTITKTLSIRISLMVIVAMAILLMASMTVMLVYSRRAVKEEALNKASQTLDGTVQCIDNILLSVEQTAGNFYFSLMPHLNNPEKITTYSRRLVESNPNIAGCAIVFKPGFYQEGQNFMAYFRRDGSTIIRCESFGDRPYTEQVWYTKPMTTAMPYWLNPTEGMETNEQPILTFCLPIMGFDGRPVGVMGVDVSINLLPRIVRAAKPSANSYSTLLTSDGSYIVHPDSSKLLKQTVFTQLKNPDTDPSVREAAEAMLSGQTGYMPFSMNGINYYVFFKPFNCDSISGRAITHLGWSAGIVYPEDDIFGDYNSLLYYVLAIALAGLLLLYVLCRVIMRHRLLPLRMLTGQAQRIAQGHYDENIPDSHHNDEIGYLQDNFKKMQRSLAANIGELEQRTATLKERGEGLRKALNEAKKADRMKMAFLHNMTNQMVAPSETIIKDVEALSTLGTFKEGQIEALADDIQQNGDTITDLLNDLINISDEETVRAEASLTEPTRKEDAHE